MSKRKKPAKKSIVDDFIFVVDASGSMGGRKRREAQDGVNGFLDEQAEFAGNATATVIIFDTRRRCEYLCNRVSLDRIRLSEQNYRTGSTTPLYEACIRAIEGHEGDADSVTVIIATDGLENASGRGYTKERLAALIREKEAEGWNFIFLGQDIDAKAEGAKAGVRVGTTAQTGNYETALKKTSKKVTSFRKTRNAERLIYTDADREAM